MARKKTAKPSRKAETFALKGEWDGSEDSLPLARKPQPERLTVTKLPLDKGEMEWQRYRYCKQYLRGGNPPAAQRARWHSSPAPSVTAGMIELFADLGRQAKVSEVELRKTVLGFGHIILM